jgi:hypothetical protein
MCAGAFAQSEHVSKLLCYAVGNSQPEPIGDREGHAVAADQYTCRVEGGLLDGGVVTGGTIWEYDKINATLLSGSGVIRKPGAVAAFQNTESKLTMTLSEGKVTGFTGTGRGHWTMATGTAAALKGKTYSYTFTATGPFEFVGNVKYE